MNNFQNLPSAVQALNPENRRKQMSAKYVTIDSRELASEILSQKDENGNQLFSGVTVQTSRNKRGKHLLRFRSTTEIEIDGDKCNPELIIVNSYSGESSFQAKIGVYRLICTNGLTIAKAEWGAVNVRHVGTPALMAKELAFEFILKVSEIAAEQERLMSINLSEEQAIEYAMKAAQIRWNRSFSKSEAKVLLQAARPEDNNLTLWNVFNVLQENLIKGSSEIRLSTGRAVRPLSSPVAIDRVNTRLYELTEAFAN
jgi:hypothetical protein